MFALNKYAEKIFQLQWKFNIDKKEDFEKLLFVKFKQTEKGYFVIESVIYTFIDIIVGLEVLNFVLSKVESEIILEIVD